MTTLTLYNYFRVIYPTSLGPEAEVAEMVLSARVASSVMISEHVHVVHGVGSVTC
jgi:hypothetical protein